MNIKFVFWDIYCFKSPACRIESWAAVSKLPENCQKSASTLPASPWRLAGAGRSHHYTAGQSDVTRLDLSASLYVYLWLTWSSQSLPLERNGSRRPTLAIFCYKKTDLLLLSAYLSHSIHESLRRHSMSHLIHESLNTSWSNVLHSVSTMMNKWVLCPNRCAAKLWWFTRYGTSTRSLVIWEKCTMLTKKSPILEFTSYIYW